MCVINNNNNSRKRTQKMGIILMILRVCLTCIASLSSLDILRCGCAMWTIVSMLHSTLYSLGLAGEGSGSLASSEATLSGTGRTKGASTQSSKQMEAST